MKAKQLYFVLLASFCLMLAALVGVAYIGNTLLSKQAHKLSGLRANIQAISDQQTSIVRDKKDITKYSELNTIAESVVPQDKNQAEAVQEIVKIAGDNGINLSSITFPTSTLGVTTSGAAKPGLTQLTSVPGIAGVLNLQITITQNPDNSIPYTSFLNFLSGLEHNRRTAQVTGITVSPDAKQPNEVSFNLVVNEYIKP